MEPDLARWSRYAVGGRKPALWRMAWPWFDMTNWTKAWAPAGCLATYRSVFTARPLPEKMENAKRTVYKVTHGVEGPECREVKGLDSVRELCAGPTWLLRQNISTHEVSDDRAMKRWEIEPLIFGVRN